MASTGNTFPTSGTTGYLDEAYPDWSNPGYVTADDTSYASITLGLGTSSDYLIGAGFGFAIPETATITGVAVTVTRGATGNITENLVQLCDGSTLLGSNGTQWDNLNITGLQPKTFGGNGHLWDCNLTPSFINSSSFGIAYNVYAAQNNKTTNVDYFQINVYYSTGVTNNSIFYGCNI